MDDDLERWKSWTKELSWRKIAWWPHRDLCRLGIDTINLLCALGLPGAEKMDINYCRRKIEQWAEKVKFHTAQMTHVFERNPERYGNSLGYFKALTLVTVLQRDCGVRYNPAIRDNTTPLTVADSFLFGIIQGDGGSCASMPVLYCAVGYLLGYPMFLMRAKGAAANHVYVQWDDGEVRFNIEATAEGMQTPTDDHYRTGRFQIAPEIERRGYFLKKCNMRHCFAGFLCERAYHWKDLKEYQPAIESMLWSAALNPENEGYVETAKVFYGEWSQRLHARKPPEFPDIFINPLQCRRFADTLPLKYEYELCSLETMNCLLKDRDHDRKLWEPLRRGEKPRGVPVEVEATVAKDGGRTIRFFFEKQNKPNQRGFDNV